MAVERNTSVRRYVQNLGGVFAWFSFLIWIIFRKWSKWTRDWRVFTPFIYCQYFWMKKTRFVVIWKPNKKSEKYGNMLVVRQSICHTLQQSDKFTKMWYWRNLITTVFNCSFSCMEVLHDNTILYKQKNLVFRNPAPLLTSCLRSEPFT